jgi:hypothetical protein
VGRGGPGGCVRVEDGEGVRELRANAGSAVGPRGWDGSRRRYWRRQPALAAGAG